ncbi:nucleotidyl transferase AbiEii/AbiGii toxin family protein [Catellatospora aurea]|uniref:Nucleotidyl transferase AbiEii/AbiGii toxin family protein n=1 Tax=Catellatospora aurea TaxID=1337874 RepID=A0ABW2H3C5_9ACTN
MNVLSDAFRQVASDLNGRNLRWALVGGFAVSARAEPRFTRDIDIAVAVHTDADAEQLVRSLIGGGYRLFASVEQDTTGRLATVRLTRKVTAEDDVVVDLLFASSGIEPEIAAAAELLEILPGLSLPVATAGHLIALKVLARDDETRPQDLADLRALHAEATAKDLEDAREALKIITERGYHRDRDLLLAFDKSAPHAD